MKPSLIVHMPDCNVVHGQSKNKKMALDNQEAKAKQPLMIN